MSPALPKNWHYVYLLRSLKNNEIYIGCTNDIRSRIEEHNEGKVFSTKSILPIELIYAEAYCSKDLAYKRERSLKSYGSGLRHIKIRLGINRKGRAG